MQYSLSNRLSSNVSGIDADAKAYIAAVESVLPGNSIEAALPNASNPKRIISDFFKAEKAASRWSLHKRIYLPIYNNAAASAIDMVSRNVGTFTASGVTHAAGYVQGNGTSGKFDWGASPDGVGLIDGSACLWNLVLQAHSTTSFNATAGVSQISPARRTIRLNRFGGSDTFESGVNVGGSTSGVGIFIGSETATNFRFYRRLTSSGAASIASNTSAVTGGFPTINMQSMCSNNSLAFSNFSDARLGAFGMGLGMTVAQADAFTANLKTLWETLTGLTLP